MKPIKLGIVLTRLKAEKKKDELVNIDSKHRPWLKDIPKKLTIMRDNKRCTS